MKWSALKKGLTIFAFSRRSNIGKPQGNCRGHDAFAGRDMRYSRFGLNHLQGGTRMRIPIKLNNLFNGSDQ